MDVKDIASRLGAGKVLDVAPFGNGHINDTFKITTPDQLYILQKINTEIFQDPDGMMDNICLVTEHLRRKGKRTFKVIGYECPWRLISFIGGTHSVDVVSNVEEARTAAEAFATFQSDLSDLDSHKLVYSIPKFHNVEYTLKKFDEAVNTDFAFRSKKAKSEIDFIESRRDNIVEMLKLIEIGKIPIRITHNDTKINNVMLDDETGEAVAIVDLDTVMPGTVLADFGDMVRTSTASAAEDEEDLDKVYSRVDYFEAIAKGYLSKAKFLNEYELENLAFSGWLITFEQAFRFLGDYLIGDFYYKTDYPEHNLVRTRNQIKMLQSIEEQMDKYKEIVRKEIDNG